MCLVFIGSTKILLIYSYRLNLIYRFERKVILNYQSVPQHELNITKESNQNVLGCEIFSMINYCEILFRDAVIIISLQCFLIIQNVLIHIYYLVL